MERRPSQDDQEDYGHVTDGASGPHSGSVADAAPDSGVLRFPDPSWAGGGGEGMTGAYDQGSGNRRYAEAHGATSDQSHSRSSISNELVSADDGAQALCVQMLLDFNLSDLGDEEVHLLPFL